MNSLPEDGLQPNPEVDRSPQNAPGAGDSSAPQVARFEDEQSAGQIVPPEAPTPDSQNPDELTPRVHAPLESLEDEQPLFQSFSKPEYHPPVRIPHLGHVLILAVFAGFGLLGASVAIISGLHFHLFGVTNQQQAGTEIHYALGSEIILYALMFGASLLFFPLIWHKGFFAGLQWNGKTALRLRRKLFVIASVCCGLALANGLLLPGPKDAPIEKIFRAPGAAWLMFAFGVTFAPFFEELVFRGFLLPALCTGADWIAEKLSLDSAPPLNTTGRPIWPTWAIGTAVAVYASIPLAVTASIIYRHKWTAVLALLIYVLALLGFLLTLAFRKKPKKQLLAQNELPAPSQFPASDQFPAQDQLSVPNQFPAPELLPVPNQPLASNFPPNFPSFDATGHPLWSMPAMVIASILSSLPFAGMHAAQTGYTWGPFVLLVGVSLVLCWARLSTRSLAASVLVHASYNFLLFALMLIGTGGFRHLDRM